MGVKINLPSAEESIGPTILEGGVNLALRDENEIHTKQNVELF